jgi:hypothetical protein
MRPHQKLHILWLSEEPQYERSVTHGELAVAALEARYGVRFPPDFRGYLLHACATIDDGGAMDQANSAWWGLDRLRSVSEEYDGPLGGADLEAERDTALFFADHMIWSMAWAISCKQGPNYGRVFVVSGHDRFVASNFAGFVDQYIADHQDLL